MVAAHIIVSGLVQGVGYRFFVSSKAEDLGLTGYVRNLPDGNVEILAMGPRGLIGELVAALKIGPRASRVRGVSLDWVTPAEEFDRFEIR
ncbi:MAG TPA: acylphosphatase [Bacteroidota bacterium]|nr:acylphosphatase [Bacteroidota bacterium]